MALMAERLRVRGYVLAGAAGVVALAMVLFVWATGVTIFGAIVVPGVVMSDQQQRSIQHPVGGVLAEVLVREGDAVVAGDVLARLDTAYQRAELEVIEGDLLEIVLRQERLHAEVIGQQDLEFQSAVLERLARRSDFDGVILQETAVFEAKRDSLIAELQRLDRADETILAEVVGITDQLGALARTAGLVRRDLGNQRSLADRGLVPLTSVLALEKEEAAIDAQISELLARREEANKRLSGLDAERDATRAGYRFRSSDALREATSRARGLKAEAARLRHEVAAAELRAPVDGVVFGMSGIAALSVLGPLEPLMQIVPKRGGQIITARVSASDVDQVQVGQPVTLRLSELDQRTTPELEGRVARVAAAPTTDERSGSDYFLLEIHLTLAELARLPATARLLPGMPVETFIRTGDRTPLSYIIKPVKDYFASAFREG